MSADGAAPELTCSAKGCAAPAAVEVRWNNPKIHTPDRRKIWLACPDHRDHLQSFLSARGFWRETEPLGSADE
ncbi:MAG: acetone carboxylase [Aeromicrobium sp.]|uniref:acetone carboxylase n=1 Tax=Aeromicrobium sp. TaxID=1871063 RepID=UPI0039E5077E